ncbi:hypothetical protein CCC_04108 [Paramagnetospirillum magnetotacticum MS-1]|uniref:Uncharacterized protein n=1 Tax=Paramagnetospirillum magnetotacticum MS-1 TaxID=272627 RepID=A0A0C2UDP7_PARME|nr:hypothetical protein CCC_04108 [Paramagnetospirillum magnetotacticum MS-1]
MKLAEICAAALIEAAECIEAARDVGAFVDALDGNHRLWLILRDIEARDDWIAPSIQDTEFATMNSAALGMGISDAVVGAVVVINRQIAGQLACGADLDGIRARVRLAYRESGGGSGFAPWALAQIYTRSRRRSAFPRTEQRGGCQAEAGANLQLS